jgi:hypothetical protein
MWRETDVIRISLMAGRHHNRWRCHNRVEDREPTLASGPAATELVRNEPTQIVRNLSVIMHFKSAGWFFRACELSPRCLLVPAPTAIPAASAWQKNDKDNNEKCGEIMCISYA